MEGAAHIFRDALGVGDLLDPFHHAAEHGAKIDLLQRFAAARATRHLAHQDDERCRILHRDMDAGAGIGGARAAGDQAEAGLAGELAIGLGHHRGAALLAADDEANRIGVVQRVEKRQIALARHAKRSIGAVQLELVDQDLRGGTGCQGPASRKLRVIDLLVFASIGNGKAFKIPQ